MRLKFCEERIKILEQVASGKLSVEAHLLQEKENLVKELEVLQCQLDRNPEITKFAMENLQLKEDLRRLALLSILWCSLNGCGLIFFLCDRWRIITDS
jgi:kinesin family member 15